MDMSDNELATLAGRGDSGAFQTLFERYQHPVYNFVYRMVDNAEDAADIVQNAFIRMYSILGEKEIDNFSAYLYRTARNLSYDEMRRRQRYADVDHELLAPEDPNIYADPQRALMLGEQIDAVRRAVGNLGENQRAALLLRELQDLDYDSMSEILDSNRNAVGALLSRARLRLREELRMAQIQTQEIPPECEEIISLLSPYIDGELPAASVPRVEEHVAGCTFCAAALEEMREASRSFRMLIPVVPPADIAQAVTGRIQELSGQGGMGEGGEGPGEGGGDQGGEGFGEGGQGYGSAGAEPPGGSGGMEGQTEVYAGARSGPLLTRRKKILLGLAAVLAIFSIGGFIMADPFGTDDEPEPAETVPAAVKTTRSTGNTRTQSAPEAPAVTTVPQAEDDVTVPGIDDPESPAEEPPPVDETAPGDQYGTGEEPAGEQPIRPTMPEIPVVTPGTIR